MEIVFKSDEKLVLTFVQDRVTVSIYAFLIFGFLGWINDFQDDFSSRYSQIPLIIIISILGFWFLINPSFNFYNHFRIQDELILISIIIFYFLTGPSPFHNTTTIEFDKQKKIITFMEKGWIRRKDSVYSLDAVQGVIYKEEKRKAYTLYGVELTFAERKIYFPKRTYCKEIPKEKYVRIVSEIYNFVNL